jgi:hypothetical protein
MPIVQGVTKLLVKMAAGQDLDSLTLDKARVPLAASPLFQSIGTTGDLGGQPDSQWYVVTPEPGFAEDNSWDLCHSLVSGQLGFSGANPPQFAEPDLKQQWITGESNDDALSMAATCEAPAEQNPKFPRNSDYLWYQDAEHGQFSAARAMAGEPADGALVRIAHLDTGYDPGHKALPPLLNRGLQKNFVDGGRPNDASDTTDGLLTNLGHGTGTISILASRISGGDVIGGAPAAEVVPIRVADRVVLFENSAIAKALDYVHELCRTPATRVDVITLSMGGLASQAWAEAVNALYEVGVFIVTAAGNNFGNIPTHHIVYPARFGRVVAACGVMADHTAYADLGLERMAGNYGPKDKMKTAIAGFTPNTPWAHLGCASIVDRDGAGTSAATPQIAAAAALWIQKNRDALDQYPNAWMRVEAVRDALFGSASLEAGGDAKRLGRGELRAEEALGRQPAAPETLTKMPVDDASFPFLKILTGLGVDDGLSPAGRRMLELEALQLSQSAEVEAVLDKLEKPPEALSQQELRKVFDVLAAQPGASCKLRGTLGLNGTRPVRTVPPPVKISTAVKRLHISHALAPEPPKPVTRRLRVFAYDPSVELRLDTLSLNEATLDVRWEKDLQPGPVGEYLEVIDVDPSSQCCYAPINLNHPHLLVQDGLRPAEANPQFHQQMAYAVAMKTIQHFEEALGRVALWTPRRVERDGKFLREDYVQRLRIYPHALRAENAYYSPDRVALLLGYFTASESSSGDVLPGAVIFSAVSHDIVAHETTHALLDGLHRRYKEATNIDVLAFHEGFADIVALFQHFTIPESLRSQISKARGSLRQNNLLAQLAVQFGLATGHYGALRAAIGKIDKNTGDWSAEAPKGDEYRRATEAHARGAVLVAAVFDAFVRIYEMRATDLIRLATGGTGVLPEGELSAPLASALTREASKVARQVLTICIRALDYCPPVDIMFGEYLRALITADRDIVPDDKRSYRVAFISAFKDRGIYPGDVRHLSVDSVAWEPPPLPLAKIGDIIDAMALSWNLTSDRHAAYVASKINARRFHDWLIDPKEVTDEEIEALGLLRDPSTVTAIGGRPGVMGGIEVHSVRPARRIGPDGQSRADLVIEITQTFRLSPPEAAKLRGGCTLLVDLEKKQVRYFVRKRVASGDRLETQLKIAGDNAAGFQNTYSDGSRKQAEPFAMLHRSVG